MRVTIPDSASAILNPNVWQHQPGQKPGAWQLNLKRTYDISCRKSLHNSALLPETGLEPAQSCDYQALNLFSLVSPHLTRTGNTLELLASLTTYVQSQGDYVLLGLGQHGPMLPFFCPPELAGFLLTVRSPF
jgi:hypothetical protein